MEEFKKTNFVRERPGEDFPAYESLEAAVAKAIHDKIAMIVGAIGVEDPVALARAVDACERPVVGPGSDAERESFDLLEIFGRLGIAPMQHCYINWHNFENIDRLETKALAKYFDDVWYPSSDDIDVWDDSYDWIVSVHHSGGIRHATFAKKPP